MSKGYALSSILLAAILVSGCATVTTGRHQRVPIDSNPQGANVSVNSGFKGVTPCSFDLERNKEHIIRISKEGYKTAQVVLRKTICGSTCGNVILGGIIGLGVDAMSGAMFKLIPEKVSVNLVPGDEKDIISIEAPKHTEQEEPKKTGPSLTTRNETAVTAKSGVPVVAEGKKITNTDEYYSFIREKVSTALYNLPKQEAGTASLNLTITSNGQLENVEVVDAHSTVSAEFKQEIIQAVFKLAPFPSFPKDIEKEKITLALPVTFSK